MNIDFAHSELCLATDKPVRLENAKGWIVVCAAGTVWITEPANPEDGFLSPGERYVIRGEGLTLLEGMGLARVALLPPDSGAPLPGDRFKVKHARQSRPAEPLAQHITTSTIA